jgi:FkbM family methyltransferase
MTVFEHRYKPSLLGRLARGTKYLMARLLLPGRPLTSAPTVLGLRFACLPSDAVGRCIYRRGIYEPNLLDCIWNNVHIRDGDLAIDIGANIGWYTCIFGTMLAGRGRVIALEPEPRNHELLQRNIRMNRLTNIEPIQCAASESPGSLSLHLYKSSNRGRHSVLPIHDGRTVTIPSARVDDLLAQRGLGDASIAILKIDVEGYEVIALRGAQRALRRCRLALIEWSPDYMRRGGLAPVELVDMLLESGFSLHVIDGTGMTVGITREQLLAHGGQTDLLCRRNP